MDVALHSTIALFDRDGIIHKNKNSNNKDFILIIFLYKSDLATSIPISFDKISLVTSNISKLTPTSVLQVHVGVNYTFGNTFDVQVLFEENGGIFLFY